MHLQYFVYQRRKNGIRLAEGHWQRQAVGPGLLRSTYVGDDKLSYHALQFWVYQPGGSPTFPLGDLFEPVLTMFNQEGRIHFRGFQGQYIQEWVCVPISQEEYFEQQQRAREAEEQARAELQKARQPTETRHPDNLE